MKRILVSLVMSSLLFLGPGAQGEHFATRISFDNYAKQLSKMDTIILVATCGMENGDVGIMIVRQNDRGAWYFEVNGLTIVQHFGVGTVVGSHTVRSERIVAPGGGFEIKSNAGTRYLGKADEAIKTLIMSPYFLTSADEVIDITFGIPHKNKCFERG